MIGARRCSHGYVSRPMPWKEAIGERIDVLAWRAVEHGRARGGGRRKEEWRNGGTRTRRGEGEASNW